jgi:hypothetical protein
MARYDDIDTKVLWFATIISCLLLVAVLQGTQALCYNMTNAAEERKLQDREYSSSTGIIGEQKLSLNGYRKVEVPAPLGVDGKPVSDKPVTQLQIPLERAKELLLQEAAARRSAPLGT